jgi:hypothetical protein
MANVFYLTRRKHIARRDVERFVEPLRRLPGLIPEDFGPEIYEKAPHAPVEIVLADWSAVDHIIEAVDAIRAG